MADYALIEPFDCDDGSLDGLSPAHIFTMGVEWKSFLDTISAHQGYRGLCLTPNVERLTKMARRHGRFVESHPLAGYGKFYSFIFIGDKMEK